MSTPLYPQEVFLLERYSSVEYFDAMRAVWEAMLAHVEDCLNRFTARLPADYRSRPQPLQPDIVWGQRVLPNFRSTARILDDGFIRLTHGDHEGLRAAVGVTGDVRGQSDFSIDWFDEVEPDAAARYEELLNLAHAHAMNIDQTIYASWVMSTLSTGYDANARGPLAAPPAWPRYALDALTQVRTNEPVVESGVYLPDQDSSCAQFLVAGKPAPSACIGFNGQQYTSKSPALWTRVRRVDGATVADGLTDLLPAASGNRLTGRVAGQQVCPRSGWWYTPAIANSRRYFQQGEVFPDAAGTEYGATIWQWDRAQTDPQL